MLFTQRVVDDLTDVFTFFFLFSTRQKVSVALSVIQSCKKVHLVQYCLFVMKYLEATFFVFLLAIASSSQRKICLPVTICPIFEFKLSETFEETGLRYFTQNLPQDGSCLEGMEKFMSDGESFGFPGQTRCTCVPKEADESNECRPGVPQCPRTVDLYKNETLGEVYKRMGKLYIAAGITDGCCPESFKKFSLTPEYSGVDKTLCYCDPPAENVVVYEGNPPDHSETS